LKPLPDGRNPDGPGKKGIETYDKGQGVLDLREEP